MIWIIIYLIGCILAMIVFIKYTIKEDDYTLSMIAPTIFFGMLSWMGMITILLLSLKLDGDTIIFKKKG
jgi:hypothetical protein